MLYTYIPILDSMYTCISFNLLARRRGPQHKIFPVLENLPCRISSGALRSTVRILTSLVILTEISEAGPWRKKQMLNKVAKTFDGWQLSTSIKRSMISYLHHWNSKRRKPKEQTMDTYKRAQSQVRESWISNKIATMIDMECQHTRLQMWPFLQVSIIKASLFLGEGEFNESIKGKPLGKNSSDV